MQPSHFMWAKHIGVHQNHMEGQGHSSVFDLLFRGQRSPLEAVCMEDQSYIFTFVLIFLGAYPVQWIIFFNSVIFQFNTVHILLKYVIPSIYFSIKIRYEYSFTYIWVHIGICWCGGKYDVVYMQCDRILTPWPFMTIRGEILFSLLLSSYFSQPFHIVRRERCDGVNVQHNAILTLWPFMVILWPLEVNRCLGCTLAVHVHIYTLTAMSTHSWHVGSSVLHRYGILAYVGGWIH